MITNARTDDDNRTVKDLLRSLSANFMYYSIIRSLAKALARLELAGWVPQLQMHECWATWFEVPQDALARKADFDSAPAPLRFCDNVSCDVATARSGCESRYYCSVGCQKEDWVPDMNHKAFCPHLQPQGGPALPKKDRAFLLHTIHTGYLQRKSDILHRRAVFMAENHGTGFYTQWNFTKDWNSPSHPVPITIHSLEALQAVYKSATQEMQCAELMQRLSRERGRLEVDIAVAPAGAQMLYWFFVLRSNSTRLHDWTEDLARDMLEREVDSDEYKERFDALVAGGDDIVEIHSY
ncbi:hypothetical protein DFH06DRAFT_62180 [Mycena polygramma]|nr:hypothetical protein DFH06DRAFT_62180 [Mycena polygramma]